MSQSTGIAHVSKQPREGVTAFSVRRIQYDAWMEGARAMAQSYRDVQWEARAMARSYRDVQWAKQNNPYRDELVTPPVGES